MSESPLKLFSLLKGEPRIGVDPTRPAWQPLKLAYIGPDGNNPNYIWEQRVDENSKYHFSVGGYPYVGVLDGKIIASTNPEHDTAWTYPPLTTIYPIELADKRGYGWRAENNEIVIAQYKDGQTGENELFRTNFIH